MVLEAVAAFALACNVLQIIDQGVRVVQSGREMGRSASGLLVQHQALQALSDDLQGLTHKLKSKLENAAPSAFNNPFQDDLERANETCLRVSKSFNDLLSSIRLEDNVKPWDILKAGSKVLRKRDEIAGMARVVSEARAELHMRFLLYSHFQLKEVLATTLEGPERRIVAAVQQATTNSVAFDSDIASLTESLQRTQLGSRNDGDLLQKFANKNSYVLKRMSEIWNQIGSEKSNGCGAVCDLATLSARRKVLNSLYFPEIFARHDNIAEANAATFNWILNPEATFGRWVLSSTEKTNLFWVAGKPGSGKSTLMRYIQKNLHKICLGQEHEKDLEMTVASFYIWKPGNPVQRSRRSLIQALLYQLLGQHPTLIDSVTPLDFWDECKASDREMVSSDRHWTDHILEECLFTIISLLNECTNIFIILDGLDEIDGDDVQRYKLLTILERLRTYSNVRLCVSSRPWQIFKDEFESTHQLLLEDLNREDIRRYIDAKMSGDTNFIRSCFNNIQERDRLLGDIVTHSSGVFLWVYLVVRELLEGSRDGETIHTLRKRFNEIPRDLDDYFRRIMASIEPKYRYEAAALLSIQYQYAHTSSSLDLSSCQPGFFDSSFLDRDRIDFALQPAFQPTFDPTNESERQTIFELMTRRINSRCVGLLEAKPKNPRKCIDLPYLLGPRISFFHHSFADFLALPEIQLLLDEYTGPEFDVDVYRLNAVLALLSGSRPWWFLMKQKSNTIDVCAIDKDEAGDVHESEASHFPADTAQDVDIIFGQLLCKITRVTCSYPQHLLDSERVFKTLLNRWTPGQKDFRTVLPPQGHFSFIILKPWFSKKDACMPELACRYGWEAWLEAHLRKEDAKRNGACFLEWAIPSELFPHRPDEGIPRDGWTAVDWLLEAGAGQDRAIDWGHLWLKFGRGLRHPKKFFNKTAVLSDSLQRARLMIDKGKFPPDDAIPKLSEAFARLGATESQINDLLRRDSDVSGGGVKRKLNSEDDGDSSDGRRNRFHPRRQLRRSSRARLTR